MASGIANQSEAPLYFFLTSAWRGIFGGGEVSTRMVSLLAGVGTVPVAYAAVRVLINRRAGVAAAALVATSPVLVWYSTEARAYALWVFLCALALLFWAHARVRDAWWAFDGWAVASVLAFATHYFAFGLIVPQAAWLIARSANRRRALRASAGIVLAAAMILPLAEVQRVHGGGEWIGLSPLGSRLEQANRTFTGNPGAPYGFVELLVPALWGVGVALALRLGSDRLRRGVVTLLALAGAGLAIALLASRVGADYVLDRNLLLLWLPLAGAAAGAAGTRGRAGIAGALVVAGICGLFLWQDLARPSTFKRDDWRRVAHLLRPPSRDRLVLLAPQFEYPALAWYATGLNLTHRARRVREIVEVVHIGGNPWRDPLRPAKPPAPFKRYGPVIPARSGTFVARFRAPRPTLLDPLSLTTRGKAGSISLAWYSPPR